MSSEDFKLNVALREHTGKGASRRLRRETGVVPAIIYGGETAPEMISIKGNELNKQLENEAFYSHIITLNVNGKEQQVILKDLQRHPAKPVILHADFMRVSNKRKLTTKAPLHFINEDVCKGVKLQGGSISHSMTELEISCLPADLPEFIEVDLAELEVGEILHISDLNLPSGVASVALSHGSDHDLPVATVAKAKGATEESGDESEAEGEEGGD